MKWAGQADKILNAKPRVATRQPETFTGGLAPLKGNFEGNRMSFSAPDWRDASVYPDPESYPELSFWAWQFLRRNPAYQDDWETLVKALHGLLGREPEWLASIEREPLFSNVSWSAAPTASEIVPLKVEQSIVMWQLDPAAQAGELKFADWIRRAGASLRTATPRVVALGEKWGLQKIQDPAEDHLVKTNHFCTAGGLQVIGDSYINSDEDVHLAVKFDFRYPVEVLRKQFEMILAIRAESVESGEVKPFKGRPQNSFPHFRDYLRVLDAIDAGENISSIAAQLLSHQDIGGAKKAVQNWKNSALNLRDSGYRMLQATGASKKAKKKN